MNSNGSTLLTWLDSVPSEPPSRYSVWLLPTEASTTRCHLPSLTGPGEAIPGAVPSHRCPCSRPSEPTYSTGIAPGSVAPGSVCPVLSSVPVAVDVVLNHRLADRVELASMMWSGRRSQDVAPSNDAAVASANGPAAPSVTAW